MAGKGSATVLVKIAGDASGLNKALSESAAGTEGFASKLGGLGKMAAVGAAAGIAAVGGLAAAAFKVGEEFDEAYDKIRIATGSFGEELDGLKEDFKTVFAAVPTSAADASAAISGLTQRLNLTGKPLVDLSEQVLELSRITKTDLNQNIESASKLFQTWGVDVDEMGPTLDKLFRASQQSGVGVDKLTGQVQEMAPALTTAGFGLDESIALLAQIDKAGGDAEGTVKGMTKAMTGFAKAGKDPAKELERLIDEIKGTTDSTKALGMAAEVFGTKNAVKMVDAIRNGKLEFGGMLRTIKGGEDTIRGAGKDTMDFAESWKLFTNNLKVLVEPIAGRVFGFVGQKMQDIVGVVGKLQDAFKAGGTEGFAKALDDMVGGGGRVHDVVLKVVEAFKAVGQWFADNKDTILGVLHTIADVAGAAIVVAFQAIATAVGFVKDNFDWLAPIAAGVLATMLAYEAIQTVITGVRIATELWTAAQALLNFALAANPIGIVVVAIAGLTAAIVTAYQTSDTFRLHMDIMFADLATGWLTFKLGALEALQDILIGLSHFIGIWDPAAAEEMRATAQHFAEMQVEANNQINQIQKKVQLEADTVDATQRIKQFAADWNSTITGLAALPPSALSDLPLSVQLRVQAEPHALGGPVTSGAPYLVGERGPELMVPSSAGRILPAGSFGGSTNVNYAVTVNALSPNPADISKTVVDAIKEHEKRNGTGWRN